VWLATPGSIGQEREVAEAMRAARAAEYEALAGQALAAAGLGPGERARVASRLRAELRRIIRRDFFPPPQRELAQAAVDALAPAAVDNAEVGAKDRRPR
jgi:hypothetical protein